jgi:hypothetical protein
LTSKSVNRGLAPPERSDQLKIGKAAHVKASRVGSTLIGNDKQGVTVYIRQKKKAGDSYAGTYHCQQYLRRIFPPVKPEPFIHVALRFL